MDALRGWTLSVCLACVAAGIVQHLTGARTKEPVIKLVLSLYILITALAPLKPVSYPHLDVYKRQGQHPAQSVLAARRLQVGHIGPVKGAQNI